MCIVGHFFFNLLSSFLHPPLLSLSLFSFLLILLIFVCVNGIQDSQSLKLLGTCTWHIFISPISPFTSPQLSHLVPWIPAPLSRDTCPCLIQSFLHFYFIWYFALLLSTIILYSKLCVQFISLSIAFSSSIHFPKNISYVSFL